MPERTICITLSILRIEVDVSSRAPRTQAKQQNLEVLNRESPAANRETRLRESDSFRVSHGLTVTRGPRRQRLAHSAVVLYMFRGSVAHCDRQNTIDLTGHAIYLALQRVPLTPPTRHTSGRGGRVGGSGERKPTGSLEELDRGHGRVVAAAESVAQHARVAAVALAVTLGRLLEEGLG